MITIDDAVNRARALIDQNFEDQMRKITTAVLVDVPDYDDDELEAFLTAARRAHDLERERHLAELRVAVTAWLAEGAKAAG